MATLTVGRIAFNTKPVDEWKDNTMLKPKKKNDYQMTTLSHVPSWLVIDATRYAIGRKTYQVGVTCDWLIENWQKLA
jgi:hypothetical protein